MNIFVKYALSLWFVMPTFAKENFCPGISFRVADPDGFDPGPIFEETPNPDSNIVSDPRKKPRFGSFLILT